MIGLNPVQVDTLLKPIKPHRVLQAQGHSHLPSYEVIAHLNRVFGFAGWDKELLNLWVIHERSTAVSETSQGRWWVTYGCTMRLTVRDPGGHVVAIREEGATGSSQNQPSPGDAHDMAMKAAISYALKRCAKDWGDQFGLSLYNGGSQKALVLRTIVGAEGTIDTQAAATVQDESQPLVYDADDPARPFSGDTDE